MQDLLVYLLKMIGCSGILLLYYFLFLRNKQFHQYNRFYLLFSVIVSFILPLVNIPIAWQGNMAEAPLYIQTLTVITIEDAMPAHQELNILTSSSYIMLAYGIFSLAFLTSMIIAISKVYKISRKYSPEKIGNVIFYRTDEKNAPFSFMNKIFWSNQLDLDSEKGQQIFRHEMFHVSQRHSLDLIFMQIMLALAWVNPFFYIIKKELSTIHEFLADQFAVNDDNRHSYAIMLVARAINHKQSLTLTHSFFNSPLKRRIAMILPESNNNHLSYTRRIMIAPLLIILFSSFALKAEITMIKLIDEIAEQHQIIQPIINEEANIHDKVPVDTEIIKKKASIQVKKALSITPITSIEAKDTLPQEFYNFPADFRRHLNKHLIFPKEIFVNSVETKFYFRIRIYENGTISEIEPISSTPEILENQNIMGIVLVQYSDTIINKRRDYTKEVNNAFIHIIKNYKNFNTLAVGKSRKEYMYITFRNSEAISFATN